VLKKKRFMILRVVIAFGLGAVLPPFIDIGCIVFGIKTKEHTWMEYYTRFRGITFGN
jgi:hypothetical protein